MSKKHAISGLIAEFFQDRNAYAFAIAWLESFYATEGFTQTMALQSKIFTGFGGNAFFKEHHANLYPLCAHSLMCYAEGTEMTMNPETRDSGVLSMMQGIEPIVHAVRLVGGDVIKFRSRFKDMLNSQGFA